MKVVWELRPRRKTVTAHRTGRPPETFVCDQEVVAEDVLPGFRVPAADLFG